MFSPTASTSEILYWLIGFCVPLIIGILAGAKLIPSILKVFDASLSRGVASAATATIAFFWMLAYLTAVVFETVGLDAATAGTEPPFKASYIVVPILLSIVFPLFVAHSWRLGVALFGAMIIGFLDLMGNSQIIDAFTCINSIYADMKVAVPAGFGHWMEYYLEGKQLTRISVYMFIVSAATILYCLTGAEKFQLSDDASPRLVRVSEAFIARRETIRALCAAAFCLAIIGNEFWIWNLRFDREQKLQADNLSVMYRIDLGKTSRTIEETKLLEDVRLRCR
jgi:hypothetical protein